MNQEIILRDYKKTIKRLEEVLQLEKNDIARDSAIKRFELCFDLAWKSIKVHAQEEGIECYSPRSCFKTAFKIGLIEYDDHWISMIEDRNASVHLYKEATADSLYDRLKGHLELFQLISATSKKIRRLNIMTLRQ